MCVKLVNLGMSLITPVDCCQALSLSVLKYGLAHTHLPKKCSKGEIYFIAALEKQSKRHEKSNEIKIACYRLLSLQQQVLYDILCRPLLGD